MQDVMDGLCRDRSNAVRGLALGLGEGQAVATSQLIGRLDKAIDEGRQVYGLVETSTALEEP